MLKGEGEGVGTKDRAGVVEMLVGLPLWTCLDLVELLCKVELRRCFCIWSDKKDMVGIWRENESSHFDKESLLSVSKTEIILISTMIKVMDLIPTWRGQRRSCQQRTWWINCWIFRCWILAQLLHFHTRWRQTTVLHFSQSIHAALINTVRMSFPSFFCLTVVVIKWLKIL